MLGRRSSLLASNPHLNKTLQEVVHVSAWATEFKRANCASGWAIAAVDFQPHSGVRTDRSTY